MHVTKSIYDATTNYTVYMCIYDYIEKCCNNNSVSTNMEVSWLLIIAKQWQMQVFSKGVRFRLYVSL